VVRNLKVGSHQDLHPAGVNPGLTANIIGWSPVVRNCTYLVMSARINAQMPLLFRSIHFLARNSFLCVFRAIIEEHEK